jgi:hypothetical protein
MTVKATDGSQCFGAKIYGAAGRTSGCMAVSEISVQHGWSGEIEGAFVIITGPNGNGIIKLEQYFRTGVSRNVRSARRVK